MGQITDQRELLRLADDWISAELRGDVAALAEALADDFVGVGPRGFTLNREQWLARHRSGDLRYQRLDWDDVSARHYGDAAILVGHVSQQVDYRGTPMQGHLRTTLVFVQQAGRWRLASLQFSPMDLNARGGIA